MLNLEVEKKQQDFEEEKEKTRDDAIPESVSKLNKTASYDDRFGTVFSFGK